ncbi:SGNH/GDSL hydrolase family protein [Portibacter marinus]|uniref:SGNH/GDSL hydrolase family protein n=1 Tax=Portibacter marinus TaxID=2898660 RepID=UPI001F1F7875|nr:SGNH/GDSL hydrolase family protein [Portibacter marinus]
MLKFSGIIVMLTLMSSFFTEKKKVIFFGDSITQAAVQEGGYITLIDSLMQASGQSSNFDLVGKGISGNKVYDLYLRMQDDVVSQKPDIVFIYIGVNDVWHKQSHGTGTDADKFQRFYQAIIDTLQSHSIDLVLVTPGVIGEKTDYSNTLDGDLNEYTKIIKALAAKNGTELIDLRGAMIDYARTNNPQNKEKGILTSDRVHLNKQGNLFVAELFFKMLQKKM